MANLRITLYGLTLVEKKQVTFSKIEPETCHELFIRQALVTGGYANHKKNLPPFWQHNQALIAEIEELEAKSRRKDILVDEAMLYGFYAKKIPASITNVAAFDKWRNSIEKQNPQALYFTKSDLMRHGASDITQAQFPETLQCGDMVFPLNYHFEPCHPDDGVTITLPLNVLHQLPEHQFDYLVPGLLHEKCVALLKTLPKSLRKQLVPIPDFVHSVLSQSSPFSRPLFEILTHAINKRTGITMTSQQWQALPLDDYYRMNFHIIDEKKNKLAQGRDFPPIEKTITKQDRSLTPTISTSNK
jgi:ATP-dependent helicase HrpA